MFGSTRLRVGGAATIIALGALALFYAVASLEPNPQITTDQPAYLPFSTVHMTGTGMNNNISYDIVITKPDTTTFTATVTSNSSGTFLYDYVLSNMEGFFTVRVYRTSDTLRTTLLASVTFEDAIVVNLDQCSNGSPKFVALNCDWQNGNINNSNSQYAEGESVPYRYEVAGLPGFEPDMLRHYVSRRDRSSWAYGKGKYRRVVPGHAGSHAAGMLDIRAEIAKAEVERQLRAEFAAGGGA